MSNLYYADDYVIIVHADCREFLDTDLLTADCAGRLRHRRHLRPGHEALST